MANALVWFRNDLRLADQPALAAALAAGQVPLCVYVHAPEEEGDWPPGAASNAWRHHSLAALDADLRARGSRLRIFRGPSLAVLQALAAACDAEAVYWTRRYEPAIERRDAGIKRALRGYRGGRDRPDRTGTSRLSPHLHFGEIAPWRVVAALEAARSAATAADIDACVRELGWREFGHHLLHHFPHSSDRDFNPRFARFEWARPDRGALQAWRSGRTGVPIVDAGMRELRHSGWMHNRVRMIVASYLCKHMRQHWREGARWFWKALVDADLAGNSLGWQWVAGTGADAAPYFRVFNPVTQAAKFDPDGRYVARWVPELADLPLPVRHAPWTEPALARRLAPDYPARPLVDLARGRDDALAAWRSLRATDAD